MLVSDQANKNLNRMIYDFCRYFIV